MPGKIIPVPSVAATPPCGSTASQRRPWTALIPTIFLLMVNPPTTAIGADEVTQEADPAGIEFFENHVRPLLAKHCYECHSAETGPDNGELVLETAAGIHVGGSRGLILDADEPNATLLMRAVLYNETDLQMPPEGKLPSADIAVLTEWLRRGAPLPAYKTEPRPHAAKIDLQAAREFWSFQPLADVPLPTVAQQDWSQRPLDRFILQRLEAADLPPSPQADRRTLIRRVTYDLNGLPPTPAEVDAFLADKHTDAYQRLVDRLLDSPHYGERWARVWLDLARYTDTTASWLQGTGQAWLYRDWVTEAFNRNLGYDDFVRLQLAADFVPETPPADLAALGFLGLSPTYWKELRLAPDVIEKVVAEEWDERIDAVSRTFLGLTVACARCHDHKFDPITSRDYYGLAGVFASTQLHDRPLLPDDQAAVVADAQHRVDALETKLKAIKDQASAAAVTLQKQIDTIKRETPHFDTPWVHIVREAGIHVRPEGTDATRIEYRDNEPRDIPVFRRGNPSNAGEIVPRGFPAVLTTEEPRSFQQGSGRLELAEALLTDAQALTARVFVNRIWLEHFGQGLVQTPSNFGQQGTRPTHPELLNWLATEFVRNDWDIKWLHREIVLSATYQQASSYRDNAHQQDPDNQLLWRMNRRRLTIEMWRDSLLAVAGNLDLTVAGPAQPLDHLSNNRRTLYGKIARRELNRMLRLYDFPEPTAHSPRRQPTTTPLQQLYVLNAPFLEQQARLIVEQLPPEADIDEQVRLCYRQLFARLPNADELNIARHFLTHEQADAGPEANTDSGNRDRQQSYVHALLGLNEFYFVD